MVPVESSAGAKKTAAGNALVADIQGLLMPFDKQINEAKANRRWDLVLVRARELRALVPALIARGNALGKDDAPVAAPHAVATPPKSS